VVSHPVEGIDLIVEPGRGVEVGASWVQIGAQVHVTFVVSDPGNSDEQKPQYLYTRLL
jgi:hypothetical protein